MIDPVGPEVVSGGGSAAAHLDPAVVALLRDPPTRLTRPRLLAGWCATVDRLVVASGFSLVALVLIDAAWTWPDDRPLIDASPLNAMAGWLLLPGWFWMMGTIFALNGIDRKEAKRPLPNGLSRSAKAAVAFGAIVAAATIFHSYDLGASEGTRRHPAPGIYQVDPEDSGAPGWVTVSEDEYRRWGAKYVRSMAPLAVFGLVMASAGLNFLGMHRLALEAEDATVRRGDPRVRGRGFGGP